MAVTVAVLEAQLRADTSHFDRNMKQSGSKMAAFGKAARLGAVAAGAGVAYGLGKVAKIGWDEFNSGQQVAAQTNAVLKSTGRVANVTAKDVENLGLEIMKKSGIDDEVIKSGENVLLTFKDIRNEVGKGNDIFNQATRLTTDLSVAMGKDMNSSAVMVGKALNDPIAGLTSLTRVGVQFSDGQKETIKRLVESGDKMKAQKLILKELRTEFGGSAEAAGKTFGGQIKILQERFNNWAGDLVADVIPHLKRFGRWLMPLVEKAIKVVGEIIKEDVQPAIVAFADVIKDNMPEIKEAFKGLAEVWKLIAKVVKPIARVLFTEVLPRYLNIYIKAIGIYVKAVLKIIEAGRRVKEWFMGSFVQFWKDMWFGVRDLLFNVRDAMVRGFLNWADRFLELADKAFGWVPGLGGKFDKAKDEINRALDAMEIDRRKRDVDAFRRSVDKIKSEHITIDVDASVSIAGTEITAGMLTARKGATGGIFKATPGGMLHIVEAGHDEAVVSLDPKHKRRSMSIISEVMKRLYGRTEPLPGFAAGGIATARTAMNRIDKRIPRIAAAMAWLAAQGAVPAQRAYAEAMRMTRLRTPYLWGGGHVGYDPSGPWDCSGGVSQVLHTAGVWPGGPAVVSGFTGWGKPGHGALEVHLDPGSHMYMNALGTTFGTSGENPGGGFGGPLSYRDRPGFSVRSYDRGGWLPRGWSLAGNFTGRPEPVGMQPNVYNFNGAVLDGDRLLKYIREQDEKNRRRGGAGLG